MFELRRLRMLHELALRGTLAAAAEALSYSPSTLSQQLAILEREAGVALFERDGRRVRLTTQGRLLAAHAERALQLDEQTRARLAGSRATPAPVRVALMQTAAQTLLPTALSILARSEPQLRVEVGEVPPEEGLFEISTRRFDLAVAEQYPGRDREHRTDLDHASVGFDPVRLAIPPGLAASGLSDLEDHAWVMEPRGTQSRRWAADQCRAAGFEPDVRFEVADLTVHVTLIAAGFAVGILPDLVWHGRAPSVHLVDLPGSPAREIFTAARRSMEPHPGIQTVRAALRLAFLERRGGAG